MARIAIIADAHGNLAATTAILNELKEQNCQKIIHAGDAIGIGPYPRETLELLIDEDVLCLMGNHDAAFAYQNHQSDDQEEIEHFKWVADQLEDDHRRLVQDWHYQLNLKMAGQRIKITHYALSDDCHFRPIIDKGDDYRREDLEQLWHSVSADYIIFGHDHRPCDQQYNGRRYLNPGSLGCGRAARAIIIEDRGSRLNIKEVVVEYDRDSVATAMEERKVPKYRWINETFFANQS